MTIPPAPRCSAKTRAGRPCRQPGGVTTGLCLWHDASKELDAAIARRTGQILSAMKGRNLKPAAVDLSTPRGWLLACEALVKDIASTPNTAHRVAAFATLSREAERWMRLGAQIGMSTELVEIEEAR